jgi:hypothetical protein
MLVDRQPDLIQAVDADGDQPLHNAGTNHATVLQSAITRKAPSVQILHTTHLSIAAPVPHTSAIAVHMSAIAVHTSAITVHVLPAAHS